MHRHQAWRLVTCIWLHAGVVHLVVNMLSLVFIGIRLEQQFGFGIYFSMILLVGLGYYVSSHPIDYVIFCQCELALYTCCLDLEGAYFPLFLSERTFLLAPRALSLVFLDQSFRN